MADCVTGDRGDDVKIDSAPQGATIYINSKDCAPTGVTPWEGKLEKGQYTVILEAPGFEPDERGFKVEDGGVHELFVPLIRKPDADE